MRRKVCRCCNVAGGSSANLVVALDLKVELRAHDLLAVAGLGSRLNAERARWCAAGSKRRDDGLRAGVQGARVASLCELGAHVAVVAEGGR